MHRVKNVQAVTAALLVLALVACSLASCTSADERRTRIVERADELLARGERDAAVATLESFLDYDPRDLAVTVRLARLDLEAGEAHRALRRLESLPPGTRRDGYEDAGGDAADYLDTLLRARVRAGRIEQALPMLVARSRARSGAGEADDDATDNADGDADPELWQELVDESAARPHLELPDLPARWRARRVDRLIRAGHLAAALCQWRLLPIELPKAAPSQDPPRDLQEETPDRSLLLERILQASVVRGELGHLRQAEEVDSAPATPWKLLTRHRLLLEQGEEGEAADVERRFLRRYPGHPQRFGVLMALLRRENRSGRADEALRLADEAVSLRPSDVEPMVEKALALRRLGRADDAQAHLELVLAQDPSHEAARLLLRRDDERRREDRVGARVESLELKVETSGG